MTEPRPGVDPVQVLTTWFSPAYPVGAYSYSHGLEWAVEAGAVADGDGLHAWIAGLLEFGAGRSDAILLARTMEADRSGAPRRARRGAGALVGAAAGDDGAGGSVRPDDRGGLGPAGARHCPTRSRSATPRGCSGYPPEQP